MIRPVESADHAGWLQLWLGYQQFYRVTIAEEATGVLWHRLLDPAEPMHGALALLDGGSVGLVHYILHRSCWTVSNDCYLQDLFVAPAARGLGIGRELIKHVYAAAGSLGCSRVYWLAHETNANARRLYDHVAERTGFVEYGKTLPDAARSS